MLSERASKAQEAFLRRLRRRERGIQAARWLILLVFLVWWEVSARLGWIDAFLLSSPWRMGEAALNLLRNGELWLHIGVSLVETVLGFVIGAALGVTAAILLWWSDTLCRVLDPYLVILNALPKIALGPVLIVWMGAGMPPIIMMSLLVSVVAILVTALGGFLQVSQDKITLMRALGGSKWQTLWRVVFPGSIPTLISAMKLGISMSWVGVIVGEFLVSKAGLGYLITYGGQVFKLDLVMASTAILCIFAACMYLGVAALERRVRRKRGE